MFNRHAALGLLSFVSALALLGVLSRPVQATEDFGIATDKKLTKALTDLADTCFACGDKAKEKGLYTNARSFFDHALRYDPDHKNTRKVMGFKKKKNEWVLDEDMIPLKDIVKEEKRREIEDKLVIETREIRTKAADGLFKFVTDTNLAAEQRLLALYHTLLICPEHREAQKAARCSPATMWFSHKLDDDQLIQLEKRVAAAPAPERITVTTEYEKTCGWQMGKRKSPFFVFHCDMGDVSDAWAETLTRYAEASRSHAIELMGLEAGTPPKEDANRLHYTVLNTRDRFGTFVEKCSGIDDAAQRAEIAKVSGGTPTYKPYGSVWLYLSLENDFGLRDGVAHDVALKEVFRCTGDGAYWLAQGMGYLNSTHMNGSTSAKFYGVKSSSVIDTGGKESMPGLGECAAGWRMKTLIALAANKCLKPSDLIRLRVNDYNEDHMALAFCLSDYLASEHKDKMKTFYEGAFKERMARAKDKKAGETPQEVLTRLLAALGMDETALMNSFKAWAVSNYAKLPTGSDG